MHRFRIPKAAFWRSLAASVLLASSAGAAAAQTVTVEFVTEIRPQQGAQQVGEKSRQTVTLDLAARQAKSVVVTGKTDLNPVLRETLGVDWDLGLLVLSSARDKFSLNDVAFGGSSVSFAVEGQTATGIRVLPDIDYAFKIRLDPAAKTVAVSGCHDKYPSYRILVNGVSVYDRDQVQASGLTEVGAALYGTCGVTLTPISASY